MKDLSQLSGEQLRREATRADTRLGAEIDRLRIHDVAFKTVLEYSLAVEAEQNRRRNR